MNIGDIWIVQAGISVNHTCQFVGAFETKAQALDFADQIAAALYPTITIERKDMYGGDVEYYHPDSDGGDNLFIIVHQNKDVKPHGVVDFFKGIHNVRTKVWE